ncbi:unnamed protein product [Cylindrotheca closterium]|uniref:CRAL-TRIO domain-containing protein n=1 Tax=Cylindrotheca closterium TaxID=2856 RepID=A0AAD2FKJ8_9STRA|nr:unnamed protein product [Cylindrotheca closterium]
MASFIQHDSFSQNGTPWPSCFDCSDRNSESSGNAAYANVPFEQKPLQIVDEMKQTEAYLAAEISKLTVQERAKAMDDVHCVGEELKETPQMIERSLMEFDQLVPKLKTPMYDVAVNRNRAFVEDPSFRLRFLRCNMHDVDRSVRQMMEFLKVKATYFGEDKVAREITLDDLNDEDEAFLLAGMYHVQAERDQNGRAIAYFAADMMGKCKLETLIHILFFMCNNILIPIPEVQKKGLVVVLYDMTKAGEKLAMPGFNFIRNWGNATAAFPIRYAAMHMCLKTHNGNLSLYNKILESSIQFLPEHGRVRIRLHYGTDIEIQYHLRSHGIPTRTCPVDLSGNLRMDILNAWIEKYQAETEDEKQHRSLQPQALASEVASNPLIALDRRRPSPQDVMLGRGWKVQNHEGNIHFRQFVEGYRQAYDITPRHQRREFAANIARLLHERGVLFWKKAEDGEWVEGSFEEAEKKVGDLFRSIRRKLQ